MTQAGQKTAFLGCGSMGEAVLTGLLDSGRVTPEQLTTTVRSAERATGLQERHPGVASVATEDEPTANQEAVAGAQVVVLGVKPPQIPALCRQIAAELSPDAVVISLAVGVTLAQIEAELPAGQAVVRAMPNTPIQLGQGVVGLNWGASVTPEQQQQARDTFNDSATIVEIPETQMSALAAISGSGPAYVFFIAEALSAAAVSLGFSAEIAKTLGQATVSGAGAMLAEPGADAATLRKAVTSPRGSTEQAIATFEQQGLAEIIEAGTRAAVARAEEISAEISASG